MGLLIGFCGAGGVGKSTLATACQKALGDAWKVAPSITREVFADFSIDSEPEFRAMPVDDRRVVQRALADAKRQRDRELAAQPGQNWILDRTPLDNFCYEIMSSGDLMEQDEYNFLLSEISQDLFNTYQFTWLIPFHTFPGSPDGFRTGYGARVAVSHIMLSLWRQVSRQPIANPRMGVIYSLDLNKRVQEVVETVMAARMPMEARP